MRFQANSAGVPRLAGRLGVCSARHLAILWQNRHDRLMKHALRRLTRVGIAAFFAAIASCCLAARAQDSEAKQPGDAGQEAAPATTIVGEAAKRVAEEPAISAEMRYRVDAFGHQLVGTGNYLQFGPGPEKLLRLDLKMQVGDKLATVQEIRGTDAYWIRRDVPPVAATLGWVDLRQLRKSASAMAATSTSVMPQDDWIMMGGLARLLAALDQNFRFGTPQADELRFNAADGQSVVRLPIWTVTGQWKPDRLGTLTERNPAKPAALPEQLPDRVELVLGRTEDVLTLFPYRISYFRTSPIDKKAAKEKVELAPRELLTLELFNVSRKPIDVREFQYQPGDQDVKNLTPFYVQRLTGETKLR